MPRGRDTRYDAARQVGRPAPNLTTPYRQFSGVQGDPHPDDTLEEVSMEGANNLVDQGNSRLDAWSRTLQTFGAQSALSAYQSLQNTPNINGRLNMDPKPGVLASAPKNPAPNNLPGLPTLPSVGTAAGSPATGGRPPKIKPVFLAYNPDSEIATHDWVSNNINPQTLKDVHQRYMKAPSSLPEGLSPQAAKYTNSITKNADTMRGRAISKGAMPSIAKKLR